MKFIAVLFSAMLLCSVSSAQKKQAENQKSHRIEKTINSQWTFNYFPAAVAGKGYEAPGFDDSKWPVIAIPHSWSTYETTGEVHPFIRNASETDNPYWWTGWGWYRKHFAISSEYAGRRIFIEFEGVQKYCKVWINGKYLGDHKGGYGSFDFDLTGIVKPGEDNVLVVSVNNRQKDEFKIPPLAAGEFDVYGGIYRDVTLVLKDNLYIPMQGSSDHEGGTFISTPQVSEKEGVVRVQTWVKNDNAIKKNCSLQTTITDAAEKVIQTLKSESSIGPGEIFRFDQIFKPVKNPHLWAPETPYLYTVRSQVIDERTTVDDYTTSFGFRWFWWDFKENFLYLNGSKMVIHGGNRHQSYPWLGDAIPKWITAMDFKDMAENLNYNFIRTAHYPNDRYVYELTDKYGIVADEEVPSIMNQDFSPEVQQQQLREMIRRDRNHPSILFWSLGDETSHPSDSKFAVAEDSTRILTANGVPAGSAGKFVQHSENNLNVENLRRNTIRGWYNKDIADTEPADYQKCGTEELQQQTLKASAKFGAGNLCTWLYEDHGADREYINSPLLHVNTMGYVDLYRIPKYAYYFWQASYGKKPMLFIQPHFWRSQYLDQQRDIVVNSNCDKVELFVNGVSKGYKLTDQSNFHSITFNNVRVETGTISAVATRGGSTVKTEIVMAERPAKLLLSCSHARIKAERGSVVIITADIADSKGNHVYGATNTIRWNLTGPATLVGPAIYESDINRRQMMDGVWYMDMPVSNIIRSTGKPGKIHISVSASGLASGSLDIDAEELLRDNTVINEPVLKEEGRIPVSKIILNPSRLEEIPIEIKESSADINFPRSDKQGYEKAIRDYILKENQSLDTSLIEFKTLIDLLGSHLVNTEGHFPTADFNFNIGHYNNCRLISGYVNKTKLPQLFKEGLRSYYSDIIISKGSEKDAGEEMNWLNWIPSGGTVVIVQNEKSGSNIKGVIYTRNSGLTDVICAVYPQFANFSQEAKERALTFISKANPFVHPVSANEQNGDVTKDKMAKVSYAAEPGRPILIPLLKFISE
jgi:beta-galactosidase